MTGRVMQANRPVMGLGDDLIGIRIDQDSTDRRLADISRRLR
jgi:hypothetical protein